MQVIQPQNINRPSTTFRNTKSSKNVPSFTGGHKVLQYLGKNGKDAALVTMSTSLAIMILRPLVTLLDKNATVEERKYAATWIGALSAVGLASQALCKKPFQNFGQLLAGKLLKLKGAAKLGAVEFSNFTLMNMLAVGITYVNTRYIGKVMDFFSEKFTGKPFTKKKPEDQNLTEEKKAKEKRKDKVILGSLAAIGGYLAINLIGKKLVGRPIARDAVVKSFNNSVSFLNKNSELFRKFQGFLKGRSDKLAEWAKRNNSFFVKHGNVSSKTWIPRNMAANAVVRPSILFASGNPYAAIRTFIDEGIGIGFMKGADKIFMKPAVNLMKKFIKGPLTQVEEAGLRTLTEQLVLNIGVLAIGLGFFNNYFSKKIVKVLNKVTGKTEEKENMKKEQDYKEIRRTFIPASPLNGRQIRVNDARSPQEWLYAINNSNDTQKYQWIIEQFSNR